MVQKDRQLTGPVPPEKAAPSRWIGTPLQPMHQPHQPTPARDPLPPSQGPFAAESMTSRGSSDFGETSLRRPRDPVKIRSLS